MTAFASSIIAAEFEERAMADTAAVCTWELRQRFISTRIRELQEIQESADPETSRRLQNVVDDLDTFLEGSINPVVRELQDEEETRAKHGPHYRRVRR